MRGKGQAWSCVCIPSIRRGDRRVTVRSSWFLRFFPLPLPVGAGQGRAGQRRGLACYGECVTDDIGVLMLEQLKGLRGDVGGLRVQTSPGSMRIVAGVRDEVRVTNSRLEKVEDTLQDLAAQRLILARFVRNVG